LIKMDKMGKSGLKWIKLILASKIDSFPEGSF
jgi:hypothetical protein